MWQKYKKILSRILIVTLSLPVTILSGFINPSIAHGYSTSVAADCSSPTIVINEINPALEQVELYSTTSGVSNSNLSLSVSGTLYALTGAAFSGNYDTANTVDKLSITNGNVVTLNDTAANCVLDSVEFGKSKTAVIPSLPDISSTNSIARSTDGTGTWVSNVTSSMGMSNIVVASVPTVLSSSTLSIDSTTGVNEVHFINENSKGAAKVLVTPAADSASVTAGIYDSSSATSPNAVFTSKAVSSVSPVDLIAVDTTSLVDGSVYIRAFSTDASGHRSLWSAWPTGSSEVKDTVTPTLASVHIASSNADSTKATIGDYVTLTIVSKEALVAPTVTIGGYTATVTGSGKNWSATHRMESNDTEGVIAYSIAPIDIAGNVGTVITTPSDASKVTFSKTVAPIVTPVMITPSIPASVFARAGNGFVTLSWNSVSNAATYTVRYRVSSTSEFKTVSTSNTSITIGSLRNKTVYEFGVQAVSSQGTASDWSNASAKPVAPVVKTASATTSTTTATTSTPVVTTPTTTTTTPSTDTNGTVSSASTSNTNSSDSNRTRIYITLLILLVAVGAGAAGYYGYQWWSERPTTVPEPVKPVTPVATKEVEKPATKTAPSKKRSSKGGRW